MAIETGGIRTREELRKFGITVGIAFGVIGGVILWRGHERAATIFAAIGVTLVLGGVAAPAALRPVEKAWMGLALVLSKVTTPIFLGIVYFVVLTPAGLIRRALGGNPLRHESVDGSYWRSRGDAPPSDLERQF